MKQVALKESEYKTKAGKTGNATGIKAEIKGGKQPGPVVKKIKETDETDYEEMS